MVKPWRRPILMLVLFSLLTSCSHPVLGAISKSIPHTWHPSNVLVLWDENGGIGDFYLQLPKFVLYSNGLLFIRETVHQNNGLSIEYMKYTQLDRKGTCQILNSIDQSGFFYDDLYDTVENNDIPIDAPGDLIRINSWEGSREADIAGIDDVINEIRPSLRNVYFLISHYNSGSMKIFQPENIILSVFELPNDTTDPRLPPPVAWPFSSINLADIYTNSPLGIDNYKSSIVSGELAPKIYSLMGQSFPHAAPVAGLFFTQDDKLFLVYASPLLPDQTPPEEQDYENIFTEKKMPTTLTCLPSDGILAVP